MDSDDAAEVVAGLDEERQIEFLIEIEYFEQDDNLVDCPEYEEAGKDYPVVSGLTGNVEQGVLIRAL